MSALPQVYASEEELARSDALRDTRNFHDFANAQYQDQQQQQLMQQSFSSSTGSSGSGGFQQSPDEYNYSVRSQQQQQRTQQRQQQQHHQSPYAGVHVQRPQAGIPSVPKWQQSSWQAISAKGPTEYNGSTFGHHLAQHLPSSARFSGHADGPQHEQYAPGATLPDAPHRQAHSNQPTFRWFKRSDYSEYVPDRWSQREGLKGRGDNTYRPLSVREQAELNRRKLLKGTPRTGEW